MRLSIYKNRVTKGVAHQVQMVVGYCLTILVGNGWTSKESDRVQVYEE